ncbi:hypothetical protein FGB62_300g06 [Gracilaria domingensis]|nr:hypothetical protein FGB62_300g06 [Gracilaria domingensis]
MWGVQRRHVLEKNRTLLSESLPTQEAPGESGGELRGALGHALSERNGESSGDVSCEPRSTDHHYHYQDGRRLPVVVGGLDCFRKRIGHLDPRGPARPQAQLERQHRPHRHLRSHLRHDDRKKRSPYGGEKLVIVREMGRADVVKSLD